MLNLNPNDAVVYTVEQQQAVSDLLANRGTKTGTDLWKIKGPNEIFDNIKDIIKHHMLDIQNVRCAFCETIFEYGGVHIEHFAPKGEYARFLYEPLNLVCSCPVCNGFAKKGKKNTINGNANPNYIKNKFKYVHPFLDNVDNEIKFRTFLRIKIDYKRCSERGKLTVDMFHWNTLHAEKKRFQNLLYRTTSRSRRQLISEILEFKG